MRSAEARLELLEILVGSDDMRECADRALAWLTDFGDCQRSMCAVIDDGQRSLSAIAARGVMQTATPFSVDLEDRTHPLVRALVANEPTTFAAGARGVTGGKVTAYPLRGRRGSDAIGMLLVKPGLPAEIGWCAEVVGRKLSMLHARERLAVAERRLERERMLLEKSQLLANMSHEFRTPLNAILGYTNMLLQGVTGPVPAPVERHLARVDSNARHLLAIVNDILDITRLEAGRMPLRRESLELTELLREVVAELEPMISVKPFPVKIDVQSRFPAIRTDRQKVKQIILNLLSNALKFTHRGSITIRGTARRGIAQIAVVDTGIGIAPADRAKIFEDFQQADSSPTRAYGGAGLGLSICRRLAAMLGGNITVESAVGVGSTFSLHIPIKLAEDMRKRRTA